jgi:hypothetical protein
MRAVLRRAQSKGTMPGLIVLPQLYHLRRVPCSTTVLQGQRFAIPSPHPLFITCSQQSFPSYNHRLYNHYLHSFIRHTSTLTLGLIIPLNLNPAIHNLDHTRFYLYSLPVTSDACTRPVVHDSASPPSLGNHFSIIATL